MQERKVVVIEMKCECCGTQFISNRARSGEKLCKDCVELRRALKGFLKRGLGAAEVLKRGRKMLGIKAESKPKAKKEKPVEPEAEEAEA